MLYQANNTSIIQSLEHILAEYGYDQLNKHKVSNLHQIDPYSQILKKLRVIVTTYYKNTDKQHINTDNVYSLKTKSAINLDKNQLNRSSAYAVQGFDTYDNKIESLTTQKINGKEIFFTKREYQVIFYLMKGYSAKQTAYHMNISTRTVECHLDNIRKKTNCRTKVDLACFFSKTMM